MPKPVTSINEDLKVPAELIDKLRHDYLQDCQEKIQLIQQQARALGTRAGFKTAFPILLYVTHQLKGSGGSYGFTAISEGAMRLHSRLSDHLEIGQAPADLPKLAEDIATLAETLGAAVSSAATSN